MTSVLQTYLCMFHTQSSDKDLPDNNNTSSDTSEHQYLDSSMDHDNPPMSSSDNGNLLAYVTKQSLPPGDLRRVLSSSSKENPTQPHLGQKPSKTLNKALPSNISAHTVTLNGKIYCQVNVHERMQYNVSTHKASSRRSLVDRGVNCGLAGSDVCVVQPYVNPRFVDVSGIDSHQVTDLPILTV